MGDYFARHFVASYTPVGSFEVRDGQKIGGNVASYFCTPQGRVIHAVLGPVPAPDLLHEAHWALRAYEAIKNAPRDEQQSLISAAHAARHAAAGKQARLHAFLAKYPLPYLTDPLPSGDAVFVYVFRDLLGETIDPVAIAHALRRDAETNAQLRQSRQGQVDSEALARGKLRLAIQLLEQDADAGRRWLKDTVAKYPESAAAREAAAALAAMDSTALASKAPRAD